MAVCVQVFRPDVQQEYVYDRVARDVVYSSLSGYNGTIFAYGQTGWVWERGTGRLWAPAMAGDAHVGRGCRMPHVVRVWRVQFWQDVHDDWRGELLGAGPHPPGHP